MLQFEYYSSMDEYDDVNRNQDYKIKKYLPDNEGGDCKPIELSFFFSESVVPDHLYRYLLAMLRLYAEVAWSRNYLAIRGRMTENSTPTSTSQWDGLKEFLPLPALLIVVSSETDVNYPFEIRAACTRLVHTVHLDQFPYQPISLPYLNREWSGKSKQHRYLHIDDSNMLTRVGEEFRDLTRSRLRNLIWSMKTFACDYLAEITKETTIQFAEEEEKNMFTLRIMQLCRHMLTIGLFRKKEDIVTLVKPVIAVLDGRSDTATKSDLAKLLESKEKYGYLAETRYVVNERTKIIMDCKVEACHLLLLVSDMALNLQLQLFMGYYRDTAHDASSHSTSATMLRRLTMRRESKEVLSWAEEQKFIAFRKKALREEAVECVSVVFNNPSVREIETRREEKVDAPSRKTRADKKKEKELVDLEKQLLDGLIDLTSYHYIPLVNAAFTLLLRRFSNKSNMLRCARKQILLIEAKEYKINRKVRLWLRQLTLIAEAMEAFEMELLPGESVHNRRRSSVKVQDLIMSTESKMHERRRTHGSLMIERRRTHAGSILETGQTISWKRFCTLLEAYGVIESAAEDNVQFDEDTNTTVGIKNLYWQKWTDLNGTNEDADVVDMEMRRVECFDVLIQFVEGRLTQLREVCRQSRRRSVVHGLEEWTRNSVLLTHLAATPSRKDEVNHEGQMLLRNLGSVQVGQMFLELHRDDARFAEKSSQMEDPTSHVNCIFRVRRSVYRMLRDMCIGNPKMQQYVFEHVMDDLVDDLGRGIEASKTIETVFDNNYKLSYDMPQSYLDMCAQQPPGALQHAFLVVMDVATSCNGTKIHHQVGRVARILRDHYGQCLQEVISEMYARFLRPTGDATSIDQVEQKNREKDLLSAADAEIKRVLELECETLPPELESKTFDSSNEFNANARLLRIMSICGGETASRLFFQQLIDIPRGDNPPYKNVLAERAAEWMKLASAILRRREPECLPIQASLLNFLLNVYMKDTSEAHITAGDMAILIGLVTEKITFDLSRDILNFTFRAALPFLNVAIGSQFVDASEVIVLGPAMDDVIKHKTSLLQRSAAFSSAARSSTEKTMVQALMETCGATKSLRRQLTMEALKREPTHSQSLSYVLSNDSPANKSGFLVVARNKMVPVDGRKSKKGKSVNRHFKTWIKDWGSTPDGNNPEMYNICLGEFNDLAALYTAELQKTARVNDPVASLVKLIDQSLNLNRGLGVQALRILRKMIENANKHAPNEPAAMWRDDDPEKSWLDFEKDIHCRQNLLAKRNVIPMLVNVMTNSQHKSVREEALLVALAMLLGGNDYVQDLFLQYFRRKKETDFFLYLRNIVRGGIRALADPSIADPAAEFDRELRAAVQKVRDNRSPLLSDV